MICDTTSVEALRTLVERGLDTNAIAHALESSDVVALKAAINAAMDVVDEGFSPDCNIIDLVRQRAALMDCLLTRIWAHHIGDDDSIALIAVGGYGRGELHPASDVDLLILLGQDDDSLYEERLSAFLTQLWDIGLEIGHSVRTLDECEEEARKDLTVITNMTEARLLHGSAALYEGLKERIASDNMWDSPSFFEAKWEEQKARHEKHHHTAYNLEPNIKSNPGGLRDIQMIGWVVKRHFGADTLTELYKHGFLTQTECKELVDGQSHLWRIRWALHKLTGRHDDRLLFDHQKTLAEQLGYESGADNLAVEQFMQAYYRTVITLNRLNEMLLQLFQDELLFKDQQEDAQPINARFQLRAGFLETTYDTVFEHYPFAMLEMFLILQQHRQARGIRAITIRSVRQNLHRIDNRFRKDLRCKALFMEIFKQPNGVTHVLRQMNSYGVLAAYLPNFENIVGRMQYDLFHAYTVDAHTLFVIRNLRRFSVTDYADEFPLASRVHKQLPKQELLYLAGLFHDIAKGRGGDHSVLGAEDAEIFGRQHGLSRFDTRLIAWLVRNHLLMSATAQRKDISDPEVVREFAEQVGDKTHLDYLYLLTVADMRGTNPKVWNDWKATLLGTLYEATRRLLAQGFEQPMDKDVLIKELKQSAKARLDSSPVTKLQIERVWNSLSEDYFLRHSAAEIAHHTKLVADLKSEQLPLVNVCQDLRGDATAVFVHAKDTPGLFARITSALASMGLSIADARVLSNSQGLTFNTFMVFEEDHSPLDDSARLMEVQNNLLESLKIEPSLEVTRRVPRQLKSFETKPRFNFFADPYQDRTVLELIAADRPGLLSQLGQALEECEVHISDAKINTIGEKVEDVFFITDRDNGKISDPEKIDALRVCLLDNID